jgi:hypothetical protein
MPVYMIQAGGKGGSVKIGVTDDVEKRLRNMQTGNHQALAVIRLFEGGEAEERQLHERFADHRLSGEWFSFSKRMLGDVGLAEVKVVAEGQRFLDRMDELSARHAEIGERILEELTETDRAMLAHLWRFMHTPLWQFFGFRNLSRRRA